MLTLHEGAVPLRKFLQDIVYDEFPIQQYFVEKFLSATAPNYFKIENTFGSHS